LVLTAEEQQILTFGAAIAQNKGFIADEVYQPIAARFPDRDMVILIAFAGIMIATNIFNNVNHTDIDEYLFPYLSKLGSTDDLATLKAEIEQIGAKCLTFQGDVRIDADLKAAVSETLAQFKRIDIFPVMIAQKPGNIVNNSSIAGLRGMNRLSHYAASKWGLVGLTKSWAIELAPYNIRVNSIHPTGVNTPMNDGLAAQEGKTPQEIAEASAGNLIPVPWIEPEDVAHAVLYLV